MNRLVIVGSSRNSGRCARIATDLFETCIEEYPDDELFLASVASLDIRPCENCGGCQKLAEQAKAAEADGAKDAAGTDGAAPAGKADGAAPAGKADGTTPRRCVIDDDMHYVYGAIESADEVIVISPVFFAGPPAQLKALLDRLQPYFWLNTRHKQPRRDATLHIIGDGHDPIGYDPLIGCVTSALLCAGFELDTLFDWVGKLAPDGTILEDPDEYALYEEAGEETDAAEAEAEVIEVAFAAEEPKKNAERPKLDLSAEQHKGGSKGSGKQGGSGGNRGGQGGKGNKGGNGGNPSGQGGKSNGGNKGGKSAQGNKGGNKSGQPNGNRGGQNGKGGKPRG